MSIVKIELNLSCKILSNFNSISRNVTKIVLLYDLSPRLLPNSKVRVNDLSYFSSWHMHKIMTMFPRQLNRRSLLMQLPLMNYLQNVNVPLLSLASVIHLLQHRLCSQQFECYAWSQR